MKINKKVFKGGYKKCINGKDGNTKKYIKEIMDWLNIENYKTEIMDQVKMEI